MIIFKGESPKRWCQEEAPLNLLHHSKWEVKRRLMVDVRVNLTFCIFSQGIPQGDDICDSYVQILVYFTSHRLDPTWDSRALFDS